MKTNENSYSLIDNNLSLTINYDPYVGYYDIIPGEFKISFKRKPNIIHRWFTRILLGWKWYDVPNKTK